MALAPQTPLAESLATEDQGRASAMLHDLGDNVTQAADEEKNIHSRNRTKSLPFESWSADRQNPMNWSPVRIWMIVWLLVVTNVIA